MNEHSNPPRALPVTRAAEGLPRLRWTMSDFDRLIEAGVLSENDRVELIGGELVPMAPKGNRHENLKTVITNWMYRRLPEHLLLAVELGWRPNEDTYLEPDILIFGRIAEPSKVPPSEVLLTIELAASSLAYDAGHKAELYAALGVRDYWVIDAETLTTRVHRQPSAQGYGSVIEVAPGEMLTPLLVAPLAVRLVDLDLA